MSNSFKNPAWITTNACNYRPANLTPSYTGYVPQQRYKYGDTFANTNAQCFQERRNNMLISSISKVHKENSPPVFKFPTVFSNDPTLVLAHRKRSRERWLASQKYQLRDEGSQEYRMQDFLQECQRHREYYHDYTGLVTRVEQFVLPKLSSVKTTCNQNDDRKASMFEGNDTARKFTSGVSVTDYIRKQNDHKETNFRGNCRQRAIRDQVFENR